MKISLGIEKWRRLLSNGEAFELPLSRPRAGKFKIIKASSFARLKTLQSSPYALQKSATLAVIVCKTKVESNVRPCWATLPNEA